MVEEQLKSLIIERYGSLKKFAESVDIAWSTLDGVIKRGVNKANITSLIKICEGLNIDCESLYYGDIITKQTILKQEPLTEEEQNHIKKYRSLNKDGKEVVDIILDREFEFAEYRKKIEDIKKISGIKDAAFNKIKELICV